MGASVCLIRPVLDKEYFNQWDYALTNFPLDELFVVGNLGDYTSKMVGRAILLDSVVNLPSKPLVLMASVNGMNIAGDRSLVNFNHPVEVIYLFGSDAGFLSEADLSGRTINHKVYIPTVSDDEMYSFMAAVVTLYDRLVKHG